jgi:hypothetical protein
MQIKTIEYTKEWWRKFWIHCNAHNSCGVLSTMKQEDFHSSMCDKSFVLSGVNHFTKSSHFYLFVMIQAISIPMWCAPKTINLNKWNFTSFVPNVASIKITPLWPHKIIDCNCMGVRSQLWMGHEPHLFQPHLGNKNILWVIECPCLNRNG